jgi:hypothetical protein
MWRIKAPIQVIALQQSPWNFSPDLVKATRGWVSRVACFIVKNSNFQRCKTGVEEYAGSVFTSRRSLWVSPKNKFLRRRTSPFLYRTASPSVFFFPPSAQNRERGGIIYPLRTRIFPEDPFEDPFEDPVEDPLSRILETPRNDTLPVARFIRSIFLL